MRSYPLALPLLCPGPSTPTVRNRGRSPRTPCSIWSQANLLSLYDLSCSHLSPMCGYLRGSCCHWTLVSLRPTRLFTDVRATTLPWLAGSRPRSSDLWSRLMAAPNWSAASPGLLWVCAPVLGNAPRPGPVLASQIGDQVVPAALSFRNRYANTRL
jgi:hypothetical protein